MSFAVPRPGSPPKARQGLDPHEAFARTSKPPPNAGAPLAPLTAFGHQVLYHRHAKQKLKAGENLNATTNATTVFLEGTTAAGGGQKHYLTTSGLYSHPEKKARILEKYEDLSSTAAAALHAEARLPPSLKRKQQAKLEAARLAAERQLSSREGDVDTLHTACLRVVAMRETHLRKFTSLCERFSAARAGAASALKNHQPNIRRDMLVAATRAQDEIMTAVELLRFASREADGAIKRLERMTMTAASNGNNVGVGGAPDASSFSSLTNYRVNKMANDVARVALENGIPLVSWCRLDPRDNPLLKVGISLAYVPPPPAPPPAVGGSLSADTSDSFMVDESELPADLGGGNGEGEGEGEGGGIVFMSLHSLEQEQEQEHGAAGFGEDGRPSSFSFRRGMHLDPTVVSPPPKGTRIASRLVVVPDEGKVEASGGGERLPHPPHSREAPWPQGGLDGALSSRQSVDPSRPSSSSSSTRPTSRGVIGDATSPFVFDPTTAAATTAMKTAMAAIPDSMRLSSASASSSSQHEGKDEDEDGEDSANESHHKTDQPPPSSRAAILLGWHGRRVRFARAHRPSAALRSRSPHRPSTAFEAASRLQALYRGAKARGEVLPAMAVRHQAAVTLQAFFRGCLTRAWFQGRVNEWTAAVMIQALARGFLERQRQAAVITEWRRNRAARNFQRLWRGWLARRRCEAGSELWFSGEATCKQLRRLAAAVTAERVVALASALKQALEIRDRMMVHLTSSSSSSSSASSASSEALPAVDPLLSLVVAPLALILRCLVAIACPPARWADARQLCALSPGQLASIVLSGGELEHGESTGEGGQWVASRLNLIANQLLQPEKKQVSLLLPAPTVAILNTGLADVRLASSPLLAQATVPTTTTATAPQSLSAQAFIEQVLEERALWQETLDCGDAAQNEEGDQAGGLEGLLGSGTATMTVRDYLKSSNGGASSSNNTASPWWFYSSSAARTFAAFFDAASSSSDEESRSQQGRSGVASAGDPRPPSSWMSSWSTQTNDKAHAAGVQRSPSPMRKPGSVNAHALEMGPQGRGCSLLQDKPTTPVLLLESGVGVANNGQKPEGILSQQVGDAQELRKSAVAAVAFCGALLRLCDYSSQWHAKPALPTSASAKKEEHFPSPPALRRNSLGANSNARYFWLPREQAEARLNVVWSSWLVQDAAKGQGWSRFVASGDNDPRESFSSGSLASTLMFSPHYPRHAAAAFAEKLCTGATPSGRTSGSSPLADLSSRLLLLPKARTRRYLEAQAMAMDAVEEALEELDAEGTQSQEAGEIKIDDTLPLVSLLSSEQLLELECKKREGKRGMSFQSFDQLKDAFALGLVPILPLSYPQQTTAVLQAAQRGLASSVSLPAVSPPAAPSASLIYVAASRSTANGAGTSNHYQAAPSSSDLKAEVAAAAHGIAAATFAKPEEDPLQEKQCVVDACLLFSAGTANSQTSPPLFQRDLLPGIFVTHIDTPAALLSPRPNAPEPDTLSAASSEEEQDEERVEAEESDDMRESEHPYLGLPPQATAATATIMAANGMPLERLDETGNHAWEYKSQKGPLEQQQPSTSIVSLPSSSPSFVLPLASSSQSRPTTTRQSYGSKPSGINSIVAATASEILIARSRPGSSSSSLSSVVSSSSALPLSLLPQTALAVTTGPGAGTRASRVGGGDLHPVLNGSGMGSSYPLAGSGLSADHHYQMAMHLYQRGQEEQAHIMQAQQDPFLAIYEAYHNSNAAAFAVVPASPHPGSQHLSLSILEAGSHSNKLPAKLDDFHGGRQAVALASASAAVQLMPFKGKRRPSSIATLSEAGVIGDRRGLDGLDGALAVSSRVQNLHHRPPRPWSAGHNGDAVSDGLSGNVDATAQSGWLAYHRRADRPHLLYSSALASHWEEQQRKARWSRAESWFDFLLSGSQADLPAAASASPPPSTQFGQPPPTGALRTIEAVRKHEEVHGLTGSKNARTFVDAMPLHLASLKTRVLVSGEHSCGSVLEAALGVALPSLLFFGHTRGLERSDSTPLATSAVPRPVRRASLSVAAAVRRVTRCSLEISLSALPDLSLGLSFFVQRKVSLESFEADPDAARLAFFSADASVALLVVNLASLTAMPAKVRSLLRLVARSGFQVKPGAKTVAASAGGFRGLVRPGSSLDDRNNADPAPIDLPAQPDHRLGMPRSTDMFSGTKSQERSNVLGLSSQAGLGGPWEQLPMSPVARDRATGAESFPIGAQMSAVEVVASHGGDGGATSGLHHGHGYGHGIEGHVGSGSGGNDGNELGPEPGLEEVKWVEPVPEQLALMVAVRKEMRAGDKEGKAVDCGRWRLVLTLCCETGSWAASAEEMTR